MLSRPARRSGALRQSPLLISQPASGAWIWIVPPLVSLLHGQVVEPVHWTETDWADLELTTKLVDGLFLGDLKLAGEIRQRVAKWGATVEDRARLRMTLEKTNENESAVLRREAEPAAPTCHCSHPSP